MFTRQLRIKNLFALLGMSFVASTSLVNCGGLMLANTSDVVCPPEYVRCNGTTLMVCNDYGQWETCYVNCRVVCRE